jgi:LytTr DNA-binding domain
MWGTKWFRSARSSEAIDWIEAAGKYVHLHVGKAAYLLRGGMAGLQAQLDPDRFVRISRSAIVNLDRIQEIQPSFKATTSSSRRIARGSRLLGVIASHCRRSWESRLAGSG